MVSGSTFFNLTNGGLPIEVLYLMSFFIKLKKLSVTMFDLQTLLFDFLISNSTPITPLFNFSSTCLMMCP